MLLKII